MHIELAGAIIQNHTNNILLARHAIPAVEEDEAEYIHELPGVYVAETGNLQRQLEQKLGQVYKLDVAHESVCGTLVYTDNNFSAVYHLFKVEISNRRELDSGRWRFANLRAHRIGEIGLGPYATELSWRLQNEEIRL